MAQDPMTQTRPGSAPDDPDLDIPEIPAGIEGLTGDPVEQLVAKVEELEAARADLNDKMLRALAETQNVRKRAQREIEDAGKYAVTRFARDMLSVADNLARALQALPAERDQLDPSVRNTIVGVEATARELAAVLERHGVAKVEALGKPFDPDQHQAMMEVEDPGQPAGTVVQELAPGYTINGRLLRPAMVAVAKGGSAAPS
jgi:molecular chaperone GrpE